MPSSILNSDDGVISGTSGLKNSGGDDAVLLIQTNGTTAQTVDSGQRTMFPTTIGVGGATPSASGSGISFPASASVSSDANTLDDYEEGTWTPAMVGSTTPGTTTHSVQDGYYVKIGRVVYVQADVRWTAATGTGNLNISGFPFTARDISANLNVGTNNIALTANNLSTWLQMIINGTAAQLYQMPTGGGGFGDVPLDTAGMVWINGFYYTNS